MVLRRREPDTERKFKAERLTLLAREAYVDCQHLLRPGHLAQLREGEGAATSLAWQAWTARCAGDHAAAKELAHESRGLAEQIGSRSAKSPPPR